jgi:hypothetical protein
MKTLLFALLTGICISCSAQDLSGFEIDEAMKINPNGTVTLNFPGVVKMIRKEKGMLEDSVQKIEEATGNSQKITGQMAFIIAMRLIRKTQILLTPLIRTTPTMLETIDESLRKGILEAADHKQILVELKEIEEFLDYVPDKSVWDRVTNNVVLIIQHSLPLQPKGLAGVFA